jgi:hypothetical protein
MLNIDMQIYKNGELIDTIRNPDYIPPVGEYMVCGPRNENLFITEKITRPGNSLGPTVIIVKTTR